MTKAYNVRLVSSLISYTDAEICDMYKTRRLHPQTVRAWIKEGLPVIDGQKPSLVFGGQLIEFLKRRNASHKIEMAFEEFFCLSCKMPHIPLHRCIVAIQDGKAIKGRALCPLTKKPMMKMYKIDDYARLKNFFVLVDESGLYDSSTPALNANIRAQGESGRCDSQKQGELEI